MNRKLLVAATLCVLAAKPASAQVFDEVKAARIGQSKIAAQMEIIDKATIDKNNVATIGHGADTRHVDRKWLTGLLSGHYPPLPVGYSYATEAERVAFALSYENWLRENGESTEATVLVPYGHRLSYAEQWWSKHSVARFRKDRPGEWAAASVIDAGYLIRETAKQLQIGGADGSRNENELLAVYDKKGSVVKKDGIQIPAVSGSKPFKPELIAVDKSTLGCSLKVGDKEVRRVWESGYGGTTATERAQFAYDFMAFLNQHQSTPDGYNKALVWSEQWWTDNCEEYRAQNPGSALAVSPYKDWARDSVVDALLLGYLANKELGLLTPHGSEYFQSLVASAVDSARADYQSNDSKIPRHLLPN